jgi:MFS family permease
VTIVNGEKRQAWYVGVTGYMWLVLLIASLGWIFDIFEGQIFVASMKEAMPSLLPAGTLEGTVDFYNNIALGAFLVGGALGGVLFGMLSDRIGRTRTMILTILVYSLFTCVTAFAQNWWQMTILRFLVAMGTGGEWAVASAMVAEVFPKRARAWSLGIFHASSVLGTYLAALAGAVVVGNPHLGWRWGFVIGAFPALLTIWIRWSLREPEQWQQARERAQENAAERPGRLLDLFSRSLVRSSLVGLFLATVGLATFWGVHIYGRELLRSIVERPYLREHASRIDAHVQSMRVVVADLTRDAGVTEIATSQIQEALADVNPDHRDTLLGAVPEGLSSLPRKEVEALPTRVGKQMRTSILQALPTEDKRSFKNWEMLGMFLVTTGGGLGLLSFGPICERIGRRATFLFFHLGGLVTALVVFQLMADVSASALCWMLPVFGYMTLGMHAGYAIYFPELFPTRLRGTGGGFCFNGGRFLAASILLVRGWMRSEQGLGLTLETTASLLSLLFLVGVVVLLAAPETKGRELPE